MTTTRDDGGFRRAVLLMTATSFLVPAAGVVTAPILARALSTDGRGELAAALAPAGLTLAAATLGLPDALTYFVAKNPRVTRRVVGWSALITFGLGVVCVLLTLLAAPFLSGGDLTLGRLILLATVLTVPALVVNVLRGAAIGRQMWRTVAVERLVNTVARVGALVVLYALGSLTVLSAVLVSVLTPVLAGVVYAGVLRRGSGHHPDQDSDPSPAGPTVGPGADLAPGPPEGAAPVATRVAVDVGPAEHGTVDMRRVLSFGSKVWFGSVASMMLARAALLLMAPLSDVENLGLYSVATTIADMPLVVALAIQGALYGVNAKEADAAQVTRTSRLTILAGTAGCLVLGGTLPFWITPLFGEEFRAATVPTLMLMGSAILCIPGLMAATGLSAWGRPGLRSIGLGVTLVANIAVFVLLVPSFGVYGACWTSIVSNVVMTSFMVVCCRRVMGVPASDFLVVRGADVVRGWQEAGRLAARITAQLRRSGR